MAQIQKFHFILDAGHGGMIEGKYQTKGKMFEHPDFTIYEGVFNRKIAAGLAGMLNRAGIEQTVLVPEQSDVSLGERVRRANAIYQAKLKEGVICIYVSIHGNAGGGKARGWEVFTTKGETYSDKVAEYLAKAYKSVFKTGLRSDTQDGDLDREEDFYVIRNFMGPAVLTENFFFDNIDDANIMMSAEGQQKICEVHFKAFQGICKYGLNVDKAKIN